MLGIDRAPPGPRDRAARSCRARAGSPASSTARSRARPAERAADRSGRRGPSRRCREARCAEPRRERARERRGGDPRQRPSAILTDPRGSTPVTHRADRPRGRRRRRSRRRPTTSARRTSWIGEALATLRRRRDRSGSTSAPGELGAGDALAERRRRRRSPRLLLPGRAPRSSGPAREVRALPRGGPPRRRLRSDRARLAQRLHRPRRRRSLALAGAADPARMAAACWSPAPTGSSSTRSSQRGSPGDVEQRRGPAGRLLELLDSTDSLGGRCAGARRRRLGARWKPHCYIARPCARRMHFSRP